MPRAFKSFETQKSSHERPISNVIFFLYKFQIFSYAHYQWKVLDVERSVAVYNYDIMLLCTIFLHYIQYC